MSILKLSKNDIIRNEDKEDKIKLKRSDLSYDSAMVSGWEQANRQSLDVLNDYNNRINKSEWLTKEDRATYRKAMDSYIETSNLLRGINKTFGEGYSDEDEQAWNDSIASMNKGYDEINGFYDQFASDMEYDSWHKSMQTEEDYKKYFEGVDTTKATQGWQKYLEDEEAKRNVLKYDLNKDGKEAWWEKVLGRLGQGNVDTSMPMAGYSQVLQDIENDESYRRPGDEWTEEQRNAFGNLYIESPDLAYAFAEQTNKRNNKAKEEAAIKKIQESATSGFGSGFLNTVGAIVSAPLALADVLQDAAYVNAGREIGPDGLVSPFEYSQAVTGGISTHLNEKGGTLDADIPIIGGKGWGDVYGLGTSIAQSMASAYTLGSVGTLVSYFGQGAAAGVDDAIARGATGEQALLYGAALGTFEGVAEMIGIDNLFKLGSSSTIKGLIKNIIKQAGAEGAEEGLTSVLSNIADAIVMQDKSNFAYQLAAYKNEGLSETDAKWRVFRDSLEGIAYDTIAGAASGAVSGGIHTTAQTVSDNINAKKVYGGNAQDLVTEALEIDPQNAYAQKMQANLDKGKSLSGGQINRIVEANENALVSQDKGKMKASVESRLTELGESGDISRLAEVIVKAQSGEKLTSSERSILTNSKYGRRVSTELNPQSIESGEYTSKWAESIGTERINVEAYNRAVQDYTAETENASVTENAPAKENATESEISAPVGDAKNATTTMAKATMVDTEGNEVEANVARIADVANGEASLELEGGQTVKASEVDFGDTGIGLVYKAATEMVSGVGGFNVDAANLMVKGFNPNASIQAAGTYVSGFNEAYRYGAMGYPVSALETGNVTSKLSKEQREVAYNLGKAYGNEKVALKQAKIDSTVSIKSDKDSKKATKKGKVYFDGSAVGKTLTERQRASLKGLRVVAEATGVDIHIFESKVVDGKRQGANGWYDPVKKEIHLDLHAGVDGNGLMLFTASHELTHHIREVAPAKFKVFADALLDEYTKNGVSIDELISRKLETLEANGRLEGKTKEQAYDLAYEEVVADAAESMLVDSNAIEALSRKIKAKDKGLWETIKDFIAKLVARIKAAYKGLDPDSHEGKLVREMEYSVERLQKLWVDALLEASEVGASVDIEARTDKSAKYMDRKVDNKTKKRYNKRLIRDEFATNAMIWAFSGKTKPGDVKVLYNPRDNTWNKLVADNTEERYGILLSVEDTPQNAEAIRNLYNEVYNEDNGEQQGIDESIREDYERYWSLSDNSGDDNFDVGKQSADGHARELYGSKPQSNRDSDFRQGPRDSEKVKYSDRNKADAEYLEAVNRGDTETAQKMVDEAAKKAGYTIKGSHGTLSYFTIFDRSFGNPEGDWGKGFYFTNNEDDVETNYASADGADLQVKIEKYAQQLGWTEEYGDLDFDELIEVARKELTKGDPRVIKAYLRMDNPVVVGGPNETYFDFTEEYDEETDEYGEPTGKLVEFVEALTSVLEEYTANGAIDADRVNVYELYQDGDGYTASQLEKAASELLENVMDENGDYASKEIIRAAFEEIGFDGIVDNTVAGKFGDRSGRRNAMVGVTLDTTHYIAFKSSQIKQSDPVVRDDNGNVIPLSERFNPKNIDIRYSDRQKSSYAPTFYSHMGKVIDDVKLEKMGTSSILNHLKNRGVKDEEIKWSGIETFLEGKKSVTKAELQEFVAGSQLQIEEEMGTDSFDIVKDGDNYIVKGKNGAILENWTYDEGARIWVSDEDGTAAPGIASIRHFAQDLYGGDATRWGEYKLEGGSNYRELVFKMPNSSYSNNAMRGHWGQDAEGVLAHARIQDFNVNGKKMLFIEEIQSDWHNEGHQKGYVTKEYEDAVAVYDKLAEDYANKRRAFNQYVRSGDFRSDPDEVSKKKFDWLRRKMDDAEKRMQAAERDVDALKEKGMGDVPDAPFRNNYHEYVLKRLLRMAAEEGYDSIGWTTADIQSKRWSEDYAEGYRIEYDQDIPKFLRKYVKKWGATVGKERIGEYSEQFEVDLDTMEDSDELLLEEGIKYDGIEVWSMDITDSMKESVLYEGQVLYSDRRAEVSDLRKELEKKVDTASVIDLADGYFNRYGGVMNKSEMRYDFLHAMKTMLETTDDAFERAYEEVADLADELVYNPKIAGGIVEDLKEMKSYIRGIKFKIQDRDKPEFDIYGGFGEFRKRHMGKITLTNSGISVDSVYMELQGLYGTTWFPDVNTVSEQLMQIAKVVDTPLASVVEVDYDLEEASSYTAAEILGKLGDVISAGMQRRQETKSVKEPYINYRNPDSYSNRSLLANALESVAQNDIERKKLQQYKEKINLINSEEQKLHDLREQIKELSFKKGPRDTEAIRSLQFEANQAANRINTYDKQLLNLESTKALKGVLDREKALARKRDAQKYKEAIERYREKSAKAQRELMDRYQESRRRGTENRNKTAMRHKIKDVVNDLNNYLLKGTKDKHVPIELQKAVAEALDAVNMDTVGAEERIAKKRAEMMSAKSPEVVERLAKEIETIQEMGGNMAKKISRLKTAYDSIINSDDPLVANSHDDVISNTIQRVGEIVGETPLRDMSLHQLEEVYDMYRMVLFTIRNANKAFKAKKSEEISVIANRVMEEVDKLGKKKALQSKAGQTLSEFDWNNQKPVYAFERIGSDTFTEVFGNVRAGEDAWATDMTEAQEYREEQYKKHKYDSWDFKKRFGFTSASGMNFELTLPQIMSLYAYSKRDQAAEHLKRGGIVFDESTEVTAKNKLGIPTKFNPTEATAYNISEETLADIISKLTPEQKAFVDEMQDYLSTTMGEKGNEVSLELYGVKLFKEKHYFPLKSATQFMAKAKEQQKGEVKIKNSGFTKETVRKANNPIVLTPFMDVWAGHVNEMSMYHAFTLALEDFYRVYNYKTPTSETMATESVEMFLQNAHGKAATKYIDQLLKDLNGGARVDSTAGIINKLTGLFKKSAVFASASVVVQQPSAIARATALVDTKYFVGKPSKHKETWAEVKKYAPVAVIKEMGYFDTGMGKSSVEWLKGEKTWKDKVDDIASKAPALADEYAWCVIWNAVKRETVHNNPKLKTSSDEFLKLVGERFTEVIVKTQVYDSVLARSANMRSKDTGMKMATAFMGEPTTSLNMLQDALIQGKRGNKKYAAKAIGGVVSSMILNSILVSIVYAGRDDDEDKTYAEKYINTLTKELLDSFNPLTLIPFIKDIVSIAQGYDIERSDMAVITDLINAWNNLDSDNRSVYRKVEDFGGAIAAIFGLPVKNVMRDVRGMYNTIISFINGEKTTGAGIGNAIVEGVTGKEISNGNQLYEAMLKGDSAQVERIKGRFEDQKAIDAAIRKALRENDPRIKEAAEAYLAGDFATYNSLRAEIVAEGIFSNQLVTDALKAEYNYLKKKANED